MATTECLGKMAMPMLVLGIVAFVAILPKEASAAGGVCPFGGLWLDSKGSPLLETGI